MVEIDDLTEPQRAALDAIVKGKLAWSPMDDLEDAGVAAETVEELVGMKLVDRWGQPYVGHLSEDRVTLSPYGAWLLEVHILERTTIVGEELSEDPYWAETSQEPRSLHLPKRRHEIRWPWMEEIADPKTVKRQVLEDEDGQPRKIMGRVVPIDPKLKGKTKAQAQPKATAKRRKAG